MPQIVPAESRMVTLSDHACCDRCRTEVVLPTSRRRSWDSPLLTTRCEHPVVVPVVTRLFPPLIQKLCQRWMHGDGLHCPFGLSVRLPAFAPGSLYEYLIAGWIDIPPLQDETLFRPERRCCVNEC